MHTMHDDAKISEQCTVAALEQCSACITYTLLKVHSIHRIVYIVCSTHALHSEHSIICLNCSNMIFERQSRARAHKAIREGGWR